MKAYLAGLFFFAFPALAGAQECLRYEPTVSKMTGLATQQTFPGPPNYEDVKKGDKPETVWLLQLPKTVCVEAGKDPMDEAEKGVAAIQLVLKPDQKLDALRDKRVEATGSLFHSHTGHHHTKVLLTVSEIHALVFPKDVMAYSEKQESCIHFSGEEGYDKERRAFLEKEIKAACTGLSQKLKALQAKYKQDAAASRELEALAAEYKEAFGND
jgi:hypothetical protein